MPWCSKELCVLRNNTRRAFKCCSVHKSLANRVLYTEQKASYQRELRRAKRRSWDQFVAAEPDSKKMFAALRTLSGKSAAIPLSSEMTIDGTITANPPAMLKGCVGHFFPAESPSLPMHSLLVEHLNDESHLQSATPPLVTDWELSTSFDSLNRNAAAGIDGLSAAILRACFPVIKLHLLFIMNSCFELSYFPDAWRSSKVLIIGKPNKPSYDRLNSFRPISLINSFAKILEKII
jgi:hypothetical protein